MDPSQIKHITATGDIITTTAYLREVVLTGGSDAATAVVKAGGSGGTTILTVKASATETRIVPLTDVLCGSGIHVTLTGTSPTCSVTYT